MTQRISILAVFAALAMATAQSFAATSQVRSRAVPVTTCTSAGDLGATSGAGSFVRSRGYPHH